ncbi:hypothetical protein B0T26DRAFT_754100 [Lasiosphaeria miniovina]|uniref:Uncharacterized protein n=1 Tax=Lasiosphaeria miniovina TaxID=1954250 RepID=A0AA40ADX3_9PEZI|nr:uncharacterized protein B0T26DRAFT_754100 [Lasiosphaeria miniovina]KAK0714055.1 hypothetical protein B0T26DRAFT_754100 [Lasiosphaeria miniovina]
MADSFKAAKGRLVQGAAPQSSDLEDTADFIANWNALVSTYTSRDLTYASADDAIPLVPQSDSQQAVRPPGPAVLGLDFDHGRIWFHGPVQTSKPLVDSIRIHPGPSPAPPPETAPHVTSTTPSPYQSGAAFVDLFRFQPRSMYLVGGAAVSSQRVLHITDADANPVGWVVFDLGEVPPAAQALYVARVSENEVADRFDGFNDMLLAESAGSADGESDTRGFTRVLNSAIQSFFGLKKMATRQQCGEYVFWNGAAHVSPTPVQGAFSYTAW